MKWILSCFIFAYSLLVSAGEAAHFSPDCRNCETAAHAAGARVGNEVGIQISPTAPSAAPPVTPTVPPAPVRQ